MDTQVTDSERLAHALRGGPLTDFERHLIQQLQHDLFRRVDGLSSQEHCQLVYERMRYLRRRLDLRAADLLADPRRLVALHEWTSIVDGTLTTLLTIHYNLCLGSILQLGGGRPELAPIIAELDSMDSIGVFLATELGFGNNVQALRTRAEYDPDAREFVLTTGEAEAQKFMPNTGAEGVAKIAVVMAQLIVRGRSQGVFPFIVRIRTRDGLCPGVQVTPLGDKPDYPLDNAITAFHGVRVPLAHWLSGPESRMSADGEFESSVPNRGKRFLISMDRVQMGKVCLSGAAVAMQASGLRIALDYARQRKTFAPGRRASTLLSYRTYQRALFEGVASHYACAFLLRRLVDRCQARRSELDVTGNRLMALVKVLCSYEAHRTLAECRERLGSQGMFCANRVVSYWVHNNGIITAEGDNAILLSRAGRELLQRQGYLPPIAPPDAPVPRLLESTDYLLYLLRRREGLLHAELTAAGAQPAPDGSIFEAWNVQHGRVVELARTHAQRLALETFADRVVACHDEQEQALLERLMRLIGLRWVAEHAVPLLVDGALLPARAQELERERDRLCAELLPYTDAMIAAFQIPAELIDAPITGDYVDAYDRLGATGVPRNSFFRTLAPPAKSVAPPAPDETPATGLAS